MQKFTCPYKLLLLLLCFGFLIPSEIDAATEYNRYLAHIFQKYGNGGTMSFEGLEHLMYNLGLGHLEFDPTHTVEDHHPKGFKILPPENDQNLNTYYEKETKKLSPNEDDDVQIAHGILERNPQGNGQQLLQRNDDNSDLNTRDRVIKENGIVLEFKEMHDPRHRHPRENDATFDGPKLSANVCLSPKSLVRLVVDHDDLHKRKLYKTFTSASKLEEHEEEYNEFVNHVQLTPVAFMKLCPALLAQIDQHVCVRPAPLVQEEHDPKKMLWNAWIYSSCSIFILSACGLLGILIIPLMKSAAYQETLKFLVAIAVGTLSGDALMHLLPHALVAEHHSTAAATTEDMPIELEHAGAKHGHDNTAVWICGCAFLTAVFMYILENLLPLLKSDNGNAHGHSHGHSHGGHSHGNAHAHNGPNHGHAVNTNSVVPAELPSSDNVMLNETQKDKKTPSPPLTPVAFMVVIGDGLHNLTDGLAIGAAFATDPVTGMATAFAVLCHELPHELGDFALLLQTGVSLKRAIFLNIVSSVLSFVGMAVGLLIAGVHSNMTQWIYAGTAGSFLYIAFADLIPAMSEGGKRDFKTTLIQIVGILLGGVIMLAIAVNEDDLEKLFK